MATWHQMRNQIPLWHESKWTVVDNPPNDCQSVMRFETAAKANEYLANRQRLGTDKHCYIIPPAGKGN